MLINNIDLSSLGIKLYDRVIYSNTVKTVEDWLEGDIQPTEIRQQDSFKKVKLSFLVLGNDEQDAFLRISKLTNLLKSCDIQFDDLNYTFSMKMTGQAEPERLKNGNFIVRYQFTSDYAKGEREVYTTNANLTNSFKLQVLYYKNSTQLLATESITIRASSFEETGNTISSIGINTDKYRPNYYNQGVATNLGNRELTYESLQALGTLIINYPPITYNLTVEYYISNNQGHSYEPLLSETIGFTYPQLINIQSIGQMINIRTYQPEGYRSSVSYNEALTVENLLAASPIYVFYDKIVNEQNKNITVVFQKENDEGDYTIIDTQVINVKESDFSNGMTLGDIININSRRPNPAYYGEGYIVGTVIEDLITYETAELSYTVRYAKAINNVYVEYYYGTYPDWYRISTVILPTTYNEEYEQSFSISDIDLDFNKFHTGEYQQGALYNAGSFDSYESVVQAGVLQVYYTPINYTIQAGFVIPGEEETLVEDIVINALDFMGNPVLGDIIPILENKPEGYQFDPDNSYSGEVSLSALTQNSPIVIYYREIEQPRTKNVIVKYKQQLSSTYATMNTSIITINEADTIGGIRLRDIININLYRPQYYETGFLDGYSFNELLEFDSIQANYNVLYDATTYTTPVRYYTDDVDDLNWIGSSSIAYRVIDFTVETTLYDLGFNLNLYKPSYGDNGTLQYTGPVNFVALRELSSINVVYDTIVEPDDGEVDYPHRFLFLEHNDMGAYEASYPNWTMNHAYINTGVAVDDMSKLTVIMECARVDDNVPLHNVNVGKAYLFGSKSVLGSFYMRFNNQTQFGTGLTGVNTYEAQSGLNSDVLVLTEERAIGWGENTGIYSIERPGYSSAVFTYTNTMQSEAAQMPYPLYLFANNNAGRYEGGLAGIGIYGCRIYYNNTLLRDFIPVQYYDKIKDKVAPSNCLYDKVSETFFEDATGQNSFNIIDDDRYVDNNPEHQIGHCYVQYYKGTEYIQTVAYYFRASDFIDNVIDPYELFNVDNYQPAYYKAGVIQGFSGYTWDFNSMNNTTYIVRYEEQANTITVNYWREFESGTRTWIETDIIPITERDFLQVPTFGDIVRLNKYKPAGWETNYVFPEDKVSLKRVLDNSPYDIIYTEAEDLTEYTTVIRYIKKVYGIRTYETVGTTTLTFDQTDFRDGEYIDFYINKDLYKPESYYKSGECFQWYEMDERIDTPEKLKESYTILYSPDDIYIDVNYYTDDIDDANLIASTTWSFTIDEFEPGYLVYLADTLPNEYINKFKPGNCGGGILQDSDVGYTITELAELDSIDILYESLAEPHDPTEAYYEKKILFWESSGNKINDVSYTDECINGRIFTGGKIPYIDLGYRPKEIGRLRAELKAYARPYGISSQTTGYGYQTNDYLYYFGYYGPVAGGFLGQNEQGKRSSYQIAIENSGGRMSSSLYSNVSPGSSGCFAFRCRAPIASGYVYTAEGPQNVDGQVFYTASSAPGAIAGAVNLIKTGVAAFYRKGYYMDYDDNLEPFVVNNNYGFTREDVEDTGNTDRKWRVAWNRDLDSLTTEASSCGNPYTIILDAYNKYSAVWRESDSNTPQIAYFDESEDQQLFEDICQPRGTLSLFQTTNPTTGNVNIMPFNLITYPNLSISGSIALSGKAIGNPYTADFDTTVSYEVVSYVNSRVDPNDQNSEMQTTAVKQTVNRNIAYAHFPLSTFPQMTGCAVWGLKIYDRDKLVRDLIPVAEGDVIYDYEMPGNGLFDLITEIFFGNSNQGGHYTFTGYIGGVYQEGDSYVETSTDILPNQVYPLQVKLDPLIYGKTLTNYFDYDNSFINNHYVDVPVWYNPNNERIEDILGFNDFKPDDFHLDGMLDLDSDLSFEDLSLREIYDMQTNNVYYKLRTFTKTVVYYRDNVRVGSRDLFFTLDDIKNARTVEGLGIDKDLYYDSKFKHGRIVFDNSIIASNDVQAFIDAPSPIVVYDKFTYNENPNLLYLEWYRGGASDDQLITLDQESPNYLDCDLTGKVLNPHGAIKYSNHYHVALYEDEVNETFIPYQVRVLNRYTGIHRGPARRYQTLAMIIERDTYTIIEERNGWGRLKEYPIGWILLNQTEPITGPGQNPEYDIPGEDVATIPFATTVNITKLTIDRLWCYLPDYESWVKAEDISYDQAGKLYNGLAIEVIQLNNIDWVNTHTLADVGIYPDMYQLRFHDPSGYEYEGQFTQSAFSLIHSIDFVYPETIYRFNGIYYKDCKKNVNLLGRAAFSCTISDWNPDWDIFIATSWQTDEHNNPINPTLYRDTEITLTWDYFGFDNNLFKPQGYYDGIYLWNSRTWDKDNRKFTFSELIRCGTQYVIYPVFDVNAYKLYTERNLICTIADTNYYNGGLSPELGNGTYNYFDASTASQNKRYDIYIACEWNRNVDISLNGTSSPSQWPAQSFSAWMLSGGTHEAKFWSTLTSSTEYDVNEALPGWGINGYINTRFPVSNTDCVVFNISNLRESPTAVLGLGNYYTNKAFEYYIVQNTANPSSQRKDRWEYLDFVKIEDNTNLSGYNRLQDANSTRKWSLTGSSNPQTSFTTATNIYERTKFTDGGTRGVIYEIISYDNNMMIHYWIPVPKGLWYNYDNQTGLRMPDNGLFDLLTGEVATSYRIQNPTERVGFAALGGGYAYSNVSTSSWHNGNDYIFLRNQFINPAYAVDYFAEWDIETESHIHFYTLSTADDTYWYPDRYSGTYNSLLIGTKVPATEIAVSATNLEGTWYKLGSEWINGENLTASTFSDENYSGRVVKERRTFCLVPKKENMTQFYIYRQPDYVSAWQDIDYPYGDTPQSLGDQPRIITSDVFIANSQGNPHLIWVGNGWMPVSYTHLYQVEVNLNYVVANDIPYYQYPIEDEDYRIGTYLYGERITALYRQGNDEEWLFTGAGWVRKDNNLSLIE